MRLGGHWQLNFRREEIPQVYLTNNRARIYSLLEEVVEEVGTSGLDDIAFGDSASNQMTLNNSEPRQHTLCI